MAELAASLHSGSQLESTVDQLLGSELVKVAARISPKELETQLAVALREVPVVDRRAAAEWIRLQTQEKTDENEYKATGKRFKPTGPLVALLKARTTVSCPDGNPARLDAETRRSAQAAAALGRVLNRMGTALADGCESEYPYSNTSFDDDNYTDVLETLIVHRLAKPNVSDKEVVDALQTAVARGGAARALSERDHDRYHNAIRDAVALLPREQLATVAAWFDRQRALADGSRKTNGRYPASGESAALLDQVTRGYDYAVRELSKIEAAVKEFTASEADRKLAQVAAQLRPLERITRALSDFVAAADRAPNGMPPQVTSEGADHAYKVSQACFLADQKVTQWASAFSGKDAADLQLLIHRTRTIIIGCQSNMEVASSLRDLADNLLLSFGGLLGAVTAEAKGQRVAAEMPSNSRRTAVMVPGTTDAYTYIERIGGVLTEATLKLNANAHATATNMVETLTQNADSWTSGLGSQKRKEQEAAGEGLMEFLGKLRLLSNVAKATGLPEEELRELRSHTADFLGKSVHLLSDRHLDELRKCDGLGMPVSRICSAAVVIRTSAQQCVTAQSSQQMMLGIRDLTNYAIGLQADLKPFVADRAGQHDRSLVDGTKAYIQSVLTSGVAQLSWSQRRRLEARLRQPDWVVARGAMQRIADRAIDMPTSKWANPKVHEGIQLSMDLVHATMQAIEGEMFSKAFPVDMPRAVSPQVTEALRTAFGIGIDGGALRINEIRDLQCFVLTDGGFPRRAIVSDYRITGEEQGRLQVETFNSNTFSKGTTDLQIDDTIYRINEQLFKDVGRAVITTGNITLPMGSSAKEPSLFNSFIVSLSELCGQTGVPLETASALLAQTLPGAMARLLEGESTQKGWFGFGRFAPAVEKLTYSVNAGSTVADAPIPESGVVSVPPLEIIANQTDKLIAFSTFTEAKGQDQLIFPVPSLSSREVVMHATLLPHSAPIISPGLGTEEAAADSAQMEARLVPGHVTAQMRLQFVEEGEPSSAYPQLPPLPRFENLDGGASFSGYSSFDMLLLQEGGKNKPSPAKGGVNGGDQPFSRAARLGKLPMDGLG